MLPWVIVFLVAVSGSPLVFVVAASVLAINPLVGTVALAAVAVATNRLRTARGGRDEASFLRSLAGETAVGRTLRQAIRDQGPPFVDEQSRRLCDAGLPIASIGERVAAEMPVNGRAFAAVCSLEERVGSSLAPALFDLAARADAVASFERDQRAATAQVRFSAAVVGVVPLVVTGAVIIVRGIPGDGNPIALVAIGAGIAMQLVGVGVVSVLSGRFL